MSKREIKRTTKPWITSGLRNSILRRNRIYKKILKEKNLIKKKEFEIEFKTLRNHISTLCKESKRLYFFDYFQKNSKNLKNTWRGIKKIINFNSKKSSGPTCLSINNKTIYDEKAMSDSFNKFFTSIAGNLKKKKI